MARSGKIKSERRERKIHTCRESKVRSGAQESERNQEDVSGGRERAANIQLCFELTPSSQGSQLGRLHVKQRL